MRWVRDLHGKTVIAMAGVAAAIGLLTAVLIIGLGLFNVSARQGHWPGVTWAMHSTFENSVAFRAPPESEVPDDLDTPDMVALGAGHYKSACMDCHGAPGVPRSATVQQMLPEPPSLALVSDHWSVPEMHWIIHNGIKMSGMPGWPAERTDDVWPLVAFLRAQKGMTPETWDAMVDEADGGCAVCHGPDGVSQNAQVPRLDILSEEYIAQSLAAYRDGTRDSGIMYEVMSQRPGGSVDRLARTFADVSPEGGAAEPSQLAEQGRALAFAEGGSQSVPACRACHGPWPAPINPAFPSLAGQHAPYLEQQLKLWREGNRGGGRAAELMFKAARDLTDAEIAALSAYYAERAPAKLSETKD
ncbi:Cytochrome c4 precursor [Roseovarius sp. THAF27]|uniref:c-type cytochrome n=1 Tax=Roseovarius sp. THAF27 TaxID=2587850 RepID=UPI00126987B4|nr:c-type cytochrome [Roseovarius sp. THAF27]QFT81653.1 Cytochrome c4 precursor [Roseovarius sp. THAF27]